EAHRGGRREGDDPASDRSRIRRRAVVAARRRECDRGSGGAALPVVQGDHGGEEQAGRPGDRERPRGGRVAGRVDRRAAGDRERRAGARASGRREVRRRRYGRGEGRRVPRAVEGGLIVALGKVWVFAESADGKATSATLELVTKARELGST